MSVDKVRTRRSRGDGGLTLIELLVVIAIAGILFGIVAMGYKAYAAVQAQRGTAESLVAMMREAQQRAVTSGTEYSVSLTPASGPWQLRQGDCATGAVRNYEVPSRPGVELKNGTFPAACAVFKARGTATPGTVEVHRAGSSTIWTVTVERLTGRASVSAS